MVTRPNSVDAPTIAEAIRDLCQLLDRWHPADVIGDEVEGTHRAYCAGCAWSGPDRRSSAAAGRDAETHALERS